MNQEQVQMGLRHQLEKRVARAETSTTPPVPTPRMVPPDSPRRLFRLLYHPTPCRQQVGPVGRRRPPPGPETQGLAADAVAGIAPVNRPVWLG
jgi:hypothetical protein